MPCPPVVKQHQYATENGHTSIAASASSVSTKRKRLNTRFFDEPQQQPKRSKVPKDASEEKLPAINDSMELYLNEQISAPAGKEQGGGRENVPPNPKRKGKGKDKVARPSLEPIQVVDLGEKEVIITSSVPYHIFIQIYSLLPSQTLGDTPLPPPQSKTSSRRRVKKKTGPGVFEKYNLRDPFSSLPLATSTTVAEPLASTSASSEYSDATQSTKFQDVHTSWVTLTDARLEAFINQFTTNDTYGNSPPADLYSSQYIPHGAEANIADYTVLGPQPLKENYRGTAPAADGQQDDESSLHKISRTNYIVDQTYDFLADFLSLPFESNNVIPPLQYEGSHVEEPQVAWKYENLQAPLEHNEPEYYSNFC